MILFLGLNTNTLNHTEADCKFIAQWLSSNVQQPQNKNCLSEGRLIFSGYWMMSLQNREWEGESRSTAAATEGFMYVYVKDMGSFHCVENLQQNRLLWTNYWLSDWQSHYFSTVQLAAVSLCVHASWSYASLSVCVWSLSLTLSLQYL